MRKSRLLLVGVALAGVAALALVTSDSTRGAISGSAHDFTIYGWSGNRICIVCHTPHNADTTVPDAPLWNHTDSGAGFTPYVGYDIDAADLGAPSGASKLCLSCHDGTIGVDQFGGQPGVPTLIGSINPATDLTKDLTDDHPVSFTYDSTLAGNDGELVDPSADGDVDPTTVGAAAPYLPLPSGKLECATCHDVHNTASAANPSLLIVTSDGSQICLKCHIK